MKHFNTIGLLLVLVMVGCNGHNEELQGGMFALIEGISSIVYGVCALIALDVGLNNSRVSTGWYVVATVFMLVLAVLNIVVLHGFWMSLLGFVAYLVITIILDSPLAEAKDKKRVSKI